jgi:antitoxin ParD1/3/4
MPARNVNLTNYLADFIDQNVESGQFQNASEVVREGLRLLDEQQKHDAAKLERLRAMVEEAERDAERHGYIEVEDLHEFVESLRRPV